MLQIWKKLHEKHKARLKLYKHKTEHKSYAAMHRLAYSMTGRSALPFSVSVEKSLLWLPDGFAV